MQVTICLSIDGSIKKSLQDQHEELNLDLIKQLIVKIQNQLIEKVSFFMFGQRIFFSRLGKYQSFKLSQFEFISIYPGNLSQELDY